MAVGYDADEIKEILNQVNFELFRDIHFGLNKEFALSKGNIFTDWIREAIEKKHYGELYQKGQNKPVTFGDISKIFLMILISNLDKISLSEVIKYFIVAIIIKIKLFIIPMASIM